MASVDDEAALAVFQFHESRGGVRGLVEAGVTTVPPLFLRPTTPVSSAARSMVVPSIDLSLPRSHAVALVGAASRSCGIFQVTNHGVPAGTVDAALSTVRAFNEQPFEARSPFYSASPIGAITYATIPIPRPKDGQPATAPLMSWRDSLIVRFDYPADPDLRSLPGACRGPLLEYHRSLTSLGKGIAGLLSEGLGVGAEQLGQVEGCLMQCHYHPPCPEPERVMGSREHTDGDLFTVLAQDGVGGLQVRLDDGEWVDVAPVAGALLVNIGDVLKVVSNDEYKSVEHRVMIKSAQESRVSIALFFNPAKHDESDFFGPIPELVTAEKPAQYRSLTWPEMLNNRIDLGHAKPSSLDRFKAI
ncbi:1-aminocyclopropane-1-carboxylate oxidase-like protein 1 [Dichanthelium oligosanthes]|uniref:1-aminocyclopropane-1-carboxylate oxidase-like protein 1 n=1 Tax=Dichanthelium oligosanthes TaxID=888268 RepID=A0A1E5UXC2_9POAL|nr:1-aminocyclopropane-1-carboxylate oxidase-like protein 1 [Dichanthelium oligosanthes]